jgi:hypothetical protein
VNLRAAFLARSATANLDGTFDVSGGGVTEFQLIQGVILGAPIRLQFAVVLRLEVDEAEVERLIPINLDVFHEGRRIGGGMLPLVGRRIPGETHYYHNAILNMTIDVPRPGDGQVRFSWESGLASIPALHFRVGARPSSS